MNVGTECQNQASFFLGVTLVVGSDRVHQAVAGIHEAFLRFRTHAIVYDGRFLHALRQVLADLVQFFRGRDLRKLVERRPDRVLQIALQQTGRNARLLLDDAALVQFPNERHVEFERRMHVLGKRRVRRDVNQLEAQRVRIGLAAFEHPRKIVGVVVVRRHQAHERVAPVEVELGALRVGEGDEVGLRRRHDVADVALHDVGGGACEQTVLLGVDPLRLGSVNRVHVVEVVHQHVLVVGDGGSVDARRAWDHGDPPAAVVVVLGDLSVVAEVVVAKAQRAGALSCELVLGDDDVRLETRHQHRQEHRRCCDRRQREAHSCPGCGRARACRLHPLQSVLFCAMLCVLSVLATALACLSASSRG
mmetsp:Transcript_26399/g.73833  ORF Transcript_26399/g.73833 Transcript_26399/m.73833 type:complete len:362 (-) Transcript_26399:124-1209(-)